MSCLRLIRRCGYAWGGRQHTARCFDVDEVGRCSVDDLLENDGEAVDVGFLRPVRRSRLETQQFGRRPQLVAIELKLTHLTTQYTVRRIESQTQKDIAQYSKYTLSPDSGVRVPQTTVGRYNFHVGLRQPILLSFGRNVAESVRSLSCNIIYHNFSLLLTSVIVYLYGICFSKSQCACYR